MKIRELYRKMERATPEQKEETWAVVEGLFSDLEYKSPLIFRKYHKKLEDIYDADVYDDGMSERDAKEYVSCLVNEDGTHGEHWDKDTIRRIIANYQELKHYSLWTVYYVLNLMYSDYYDPSFGIKTYVKLAIKFLNDKDAPKDKALRYAEFMSK